MKRRPALHFLSFVLALVLCIGVLPCTNSNAAGDAMSTASVKALLNGITLHPQKTGYAAFDQMLENVLAPYENTDTYTKVKAAYDWTVRNINYSWADYNSGHAYSDYKLVYPYNDFDPASRRTMPQEIINRSYWTMKNNRGVCYDWAAVLCVMLRYIGIESFVHTGTFTFEAGYGTGSGVHGWTEIKVNGKYYIFDPQRDYRMSAKGTGTIPYNYFGIQAGTASAWRYTEDTATNATRDAGFLPVTQDQYYRYQVTAYASRSGSVRGAGSYILNKTAILTATPASGKTFSGWYDSSYQLISTNPVLSFTVTKNTTYYAMF